MNLFCFILFLSHISLSHSLAHTHTHIHLPTIRFIDGTWRFLPISIIRRLINFCYHRFQANAYVILVLWRSDTSPIATDWVYVWSIMLWQDRNKQSEEKTHSKVTYKQSNHSVCTFCWNCLSNRRLEFSQEKKNYSTLKMLLILTLNFMVEMNNERIKF